MTTMLELIHELWYLKRDIISDDFDKALYRLAEEFEHTGAQMKIHSYQSGETCWTWKVPEKWTCHEAYLETLDGKRLLDYSDHPLQVVSNSLPFEGTVSRQELFEHFHVHSRLPDAIPFVFKYYERDWGLCGSKNFRDSLSDEKYNVVIRTEFEPGEMKVGEIFIPGKHPGTFVIEAHLCHPAQVNDDLTGVVVAIETAKRLLEIPDTNYTYRIIIVPETIGTIAYLSHNEDLIPDMDGGLFLEMLGNDSPHALQGSFLPNSQSDRCMVSALRELDKNSYCAPYRTVINNDERQFNAPGVRVPMLSLSRVEPPGSETRPYREYHSSLDNPTIISSDRLEDSARVVLGLLKAWERNQYVVNRFKGEIFCSGYGIWIDYKQNPQGHQRLFEIMERCDGERTIADIACELEISFQSVEEVIELFFANDLVEFSPLPQKTYPR